MSKYPDLEDVAVTSPVATRELVDMQLELAALKTKLTNAISCIRVMMIGIKKGMLEDAEQVGKEFVEKYVEGKKP